MNSCKKTEQTIRFLHYILYSSLPKTIGQIMVFICCAKTPLSQLHLVDQRVDMSPLTSSRLESQISILKYIGFDDKNGPNI